MLRRCKLDFTWTNSRGSQIVSFPRGSIFADGILYYRLFTITVTYYLDRFACKPRKYYISCGNPRKLISAKNNPLKVTGKVICA